MPIKDFKTGLPTPPPDAARRRQKALNQEQAQIHTEVLKTIKAYEKMLVDEMDQSATVARNSSDRLIRRFFPFFSMKTIQTKNVQR